MANALTGENFGAGFAGGAFASFAGSGAQWAGIGSYGVLGATTLFGGIGSAAFGGDFLDGAMTGLIIIFLILLTKPLLDMEKNSQLHQME